jgi:hypothetical protein
MFSVISASPGFSGDAAVARRIIRAASFRDYGAG